MCETRLESRESRIPRNPGNDTDTDTGVGDRRPRHISRSRDENSQPPRRARSIGQGPRDGDEWMLVRRRPISTSTSSKEILRSRNTKSHLDGGKH